VLSLLWLAQLLSFKRPVDVSAFVSATLMLNISETERFRGSCSIGSL